MQRLLIYLISFTVLFTIPTSSIYLIETQDYRINNNSLSWCNPYGNYKLNGSSEISTKDNAGHLIFHKKYEGYMNSPVIDNDDNIYFSSLGSGRMISVNRSSLINWNIKFSNSYITDPLIIENYNLVFGTNNYLYCIFLNGTIRWRYPVIANIHNINYFNGNILFTCQNNKLTCLSDDGKLQWNSVINVSFDSTPSFDDLGNIYIGAGKKIVSIFPNGTLRWNYSTQHSISGSPMVTTDGVITPSGDGFLYYIYFNGSLKWKMNYSPVGVSGISCSQDDLGNIYFSDWSGNLNSIDPQGNLNWSYHVGGTIYSSPTICRDNTIYIGNYEGFLFSISQNGSLKWKKNLQAPIKSNVAINLSGFIYVCTLNGDLYVFGPIEPEEPFILSTILKENGIYLEWREVTNTGGPDLLGYNLYRSEDNSDFELLSILNSDITSYLDNDVHRYIEYKYYITAFNRIGESNNSNEVNIIFQKKPEPVIINKAISYDGSIFISWNYPIDIYESEIKYFSLFRSTDNETFELITTINKDQNYYNDTDLINGIDYYYYVIATNRIGDSNISNIIHEVPIGPPSAPLNASYIDMLGPVHLIWSVPINNGGKEILYYNIYRNDTDNNFELIGISSTLSFIDHNISYGVLYLYQITAVSIMGESTRSETVGIIAYNVPGPPTIRSIDNIDHSIVIRWDQTENNGGSEINEVLIYRSTNNSSFIQIDSINDGSNMYVDISVDIGNQYYYQIKNQNRFGISSPSNIVHIKHQITPYFEGIKHITSGYDYVNMQLGELFPNGCQIVYIRLLRGDSPNNLIIINNYSIIPREINDSGLSENTEYYYDISFYYIINDDVESFHLDEIISIKTKEKTVMNPPPPNLDVFIEIRNNTIIISWFANDTMYDEHFFVHIYRNSVMGEQYLGNFSHEVNYYIDINISSDIKYSYKFIVCNNFGDEKIFNTTDVRISSYSSTKKINYSIPILLIIILIMIMGAIIVFYKKHIICLSSKDNPIRENVENDVSMIHQDNDQNHIPIIQDNKDR